MRQPALVILLLVVGVAACAKRGGEATGAPDRPHYLSDVPLIPNSRLTDTTGAPEVEHRTLVVELPVDSVANYYRQVMQGRGWRIVADMGDTAHASLFLQRDSLSLWVQVRRMGPLASEYALAAAGQTAAPPAPGAHP